MFSTLFTRSRAFSMSCTRLVETSAAGSVVGGRSFRGGISARGQDGSDEIAACGKIIAHPHQGGAVGLAANGIGGVCRDEEVQIVDELDARDRIAGRIAPYQRQPQRIG